MYENQVRDLSFASLVADAHCLGTHWIYDEKELKKDDIDWHNLSNARAVWHKGKLSGQFTHYGEQLYFLYKFLEDKNSFNLEEYMNYWYKKMSISNSYIDSASKETMINMQNKKTLPCGSNSHDLSIIGRITPLLKVSQNKSEFLSNVQLFVKASHNNSSVLETADFFANLLLEVLENNDIKSSISSLKLNYSSLLQSYIKQAQDVLNDDSFKVINNFGIACSIEGGFPSVIYILLKYDNLEEALLANAKAGGDNSSRAMIIAFILSARKKTNQLPSSWTRIKAKI